MEKTSASVYIKKGQGRALKAGGLWIYDNEIDRTEGEFENGDMVNVFDFDGYPLGCGFINPRSTITIRMMSRKPHTVVDEDFIEMRVRNAWEYRKSTVDTGSCRLVFGEADFLPGIVIDKFSDVLVVESLALGIDRWKPVILEKLKRSWPRTESPSAASMNGATPGSASRRAWNGSRASSETPLIQRWRSWKTASGIW